MEILSLDNLQNYGVNPAEVQKALKIECFGKSFLRKSDVPKKFKEKALFLASELLTKGEQSFVTETNFSYTVWAEEKIAPPAKKVIAQPSNIPPQTSLRKTVVRQAETPVIESVQEKENNVQWNISIRDNNPSVVSQDSPAPEKYQTYRGVAFTVETKEEEKQNVRSKKKPRTYRGVAY
ncbi:hypothetical protein Cyast_2231 [Cyanobacterium stanieri PCC 7202]|uniref:Uncharacterized protein n=1 Tax=Cyanobacterium stanieri (strain ATCC 29140 / PCC 7202) TaxID=292563 RepID=K9YP60_CYASC|nr:hypothetical protein Cyast_2231 [Cyanobacterium stanieri PCC 7202]